MRILSIHDTNRVMAKLHRKKDNYNNGDMYVLQEENYVRPDKKRIETPKRDAFKIELYKKEPYKRRAEPAKEVAKPQSSKPKEYGFMHRRQAHQQSQKYISGAVYAQETPRLWDAIAIEN